jgi:hypothetical protein
MRTATVEKEWAEVRRKGRGKVEDWSWTVTFVENTQRIDQHYINNESDAEMIASLFEAGAFTRTKFGGVEFNTAFA